MVDIDRMRELLADATPTPWTIEYPKEADFVTFGVDSNDVPLIEAAVNGMYDLLNELEDVKDQRDKYGKYASAMHSQWQFAAAYGDALEERLDFAIGFIDDIQEEDPGDVALGDVLEYLKKVLIGD